MNTIDRLKMNNNRYKNMAADIENMDPARLLAIVLNDKEVEIAKEQHSLELVVNALRILSLHAGLRSRDLIEQAVLEVDLNSRNGNRWHS